MTEPDNTPPEPSWTFRRAFVYGVTIMCCVFLSTLIYKIGGDGPLMWIALALILLIGLLSTLYIAGAAFEWSQILKINIGNRGKDDV